MKKKDKEKQIQEMIKNLNSAIQKINLNNYYKVKMEAKKK